MIELEKEFIKRFFAVERQERYLAFVENPARREKFIETIHDTRSFNSRRLFELKGSDRASSVLLRHLRKEGFAENLYVMSENPDWDQQFMGLEEMIGRCVAQGHDIACFCQKSKLGFYENHHSLVSYLLK